MRQELIRPLTLSLGLPFPAAHVLLGLANLDRYTAIWPAILAMAICLALIGVVISSSAGYALGRRTALAVVAGTVAMELLVQSVLPSNTHPGYAAWQCGAIEMLLVTVAIRGQTGLAWLGLGLFSALDLTASLSHELSLTDSLALVVPPIMWVVLATALQVVLRRCDGQIRSYRAQEQEAATTLAREHARRLSESEWVKDVERATRPILKKIAEGALTSVDQTDCMLIESQLRDQIRGRSLASPGVLQAARAARGRGVRVDIFDDRGVELPPALFLEATRQLEAVLTRAENGTVKGRALPAGSEIAVTILAYDEDDSDKEFYVEIEAGPCKALPAEL